MSTNTIESSNNGTPEPEAPKRERKGKKAKPAKKAGRTKKAAGNPKADRTSKRGEVIGMMKRAKGATLPEIMKATGWQPHTVRGFVSILGNKGGETIESSKNSAGGFRLAGRLLSPAGLLRGLLGFGGAFAFARGLGRLHLLSAAIR
jgi:hypothetical protein